MELCKFIPILSCFILLQKPHRLLNVLEPETAAEHIKGMSVTD